MHTLFTNIWSLCSSFVECESFLGSNSLNILALCEVNLDDPIDSGNFSVRSYLPLIQKYSVTHMHGLAVYLKEGFSFCMGLISRKVCGVLLVFDWLYFIQSLNSYSFINHCLCLHAQFLIIFYLTTDEVLLINPSSNVFVFGDFKACVHYFL